MHTEWNATLDAFCGVGGATARLDGASGRAGGAMRVVDACVAGAAACRWAAEAGACACVLCGVGSTNKTDVCIEGTGLCIDQTKHKMPKNLRAASCCVMNARARVSSVAERTCAGRRPDIMSSAFCAVE
eukprot:3614193-Pleurochrysis_carterae.AAC.5